MNTEPLDIGSGSTSFFDSKLGSQKLMAILRGMTPEATVAMCEIAWNAGINLVEIPIQSASAVESLRAAVSAGSARGFDVGVGTVLNVEQIDVAVACGATFAVSPGFDSLIAKACAESGLPLLPGVASSSEISSALRMGFVWLKAFPAAQLTSRWITAQLAPFPQVRFVATGGMDGENAQEFLAAGARIIAVGSALGNPLQLVALTDLLASSPGRTNG